MAGQIPSVRTAVGGGRGAADRRMHRGLDPPFGSGREGWLGPYIAQSGVTLDLLKEAGYRYVMDWAMDDQPIWMRTRAGPILSVPYPLEVNNSPALVYRRHTGRQFAEMVIDQFDDIWSSRANIRWSSRSRCTPSSSASRSACTLSATLSATSSATAIGYGSRPRRDRTLLRRLAERHDPRVGVAHGSRGRDAGSQPAEYREIWEAAQHSNAKIATFASYSCGQIGARSRRHHREGEVDACKFRARTGGAARLTAGSARASRAIPSGRPMGRATRRRKPPSCCSTAKPRR